MHLIDMFNYLLRPAIQVNGGKLTQLLKKYVNEALSNLTCTRLILDTINTVHFTENCLLEHHFFFMFNQRNTIARSQSSVWFSFFNFIFVFSTDLSFVCFPNVCTRPALSPTVYRLFMWFLFLIVTSFVAPMP